MSSIGSFFTEMAIKDAFGSNQPPTLTTPSPDPSDNILPQPTYNPFRRRFSVCSPGMFSLCPLKSSIQAAMRDWDSPPLFQNTPKLSSLTIPPLGPVREE